MIEHHFAVNICHTICDPLFQKFHKSTHHACYCINKELGSNKKATKKRLSIQIPYAHIGLGQILYYV